MFLPKDVKYVSEHLFCVFVRNHRKILGLRVHSSILLCPKIRELAQWCWWSFSSRYYNFVPLRMLFSKRVFYFFFSGINNLQKLVIFIVGPPDWVGMGAAGLVILFFILRFSVFQILTCRLEFIRTHLSICPYCVRSLFLILVAFTQRLD